MRDVVGSRDKPNELSSVSCSVVYKISSHSLLKMVAMACRQLQIIPVSLFVLTIGAAIVTYCIAVSLGHVPAVLPLISEAAASPPESCIFGQIGNLAAFALAMFVYLRYRQVKEISRLVGPRTRISPKLNKIAGYFGGISCLGLELVSNFQEFNVILVHLSGSFLCFSCGTVYACLQTWITRRLQPEFSSKRMLYLRAILSALCIFFSLTTIIPTAIAVALFKDFSDFSGKTLITGEDKLRWHPDKGGWNLYLMSSVSEWLLVICFCSVFLSFSGEFRKISLEEPVMQIARLSTKKISNGLESGVSGES